VQLRGVPLTAVVDKVECIVLCCGRKGGGEKDADGGADAGRTGDGTGRDFLHVTSNIIGPVQEA